MSNLTNKITDDKLIICILPKGHADLLQRALIVEKGLQGANYHHARGVGLFSPISVRGIGEEQEKEVFEVTVSVEQADEIFEFMFFEGQIDEPRDGIIYMNSLPCTTVMGLHVLR